MAKKVGVKDKGEEGKKRKTRRELRAEEGREGVRWGRF